MNLFRTPHNQAFRALGALEPGQHWSAFDVPREAARAGEAKHFVTTIWNYHSSLDSKGRRTPTELAIAKDVHDGSLWYRITKPPVGATRKTWVAHWTGLEIALEKQVPIIGVLKDVHSNMCALPCIFDCKNPRMQFDGRAMWLNLVPRDVIGCDTRPIHIGQFTSEKPSLDSMEQLSEKFAASVFTSAKSSVEARRARLMSAPRFPRRIETTTAVFERNPDVVAEVLFRAAGVCEGCAKPAPFLRKSDGSPYLEVHHRIPLAQGGEDSIENATALCPNCHRGKHYG